MEELLSKISELYGTRIFSYEKVTKGFLSDNYFLFSKENKFFLKKYRFDNSKRIDEIHSVKKYFADGGIPVILPIRLLDGRTFFEYKNDFYTLFPFIDGLHLEENSLTKAAIISLAQTLGRIHILGKESKLVVDDYFKINSKEQVIAKIDRVLDEVNKKNFLDDFDKLAFENLQTKKEIVLKNRFDFEIPDPQSYHLIHGDYLIHNVFFDKEHNIQYVFDFEKTGYSPRVYEIFRSMFYSLFSSEITQNSLDNIKIYIDAYSSIYPISKDEIKQGLEIFFLKTASSVWIESEHYLKNNFRVDQFLQKDRIRVEYLANNLDVLSSFLSS